MSKNRYTDVLCVDQTRVVLRSLDDDPSSDYINANFVDGYRQKNAYISTQGDFIITFVLFVLYDTLLWMFFFAMILHQNIATSWCTIACLS